MSDETLRTYFSEALFPLFKSDQPDPTKLTTEAWARMGRNLADNLASSMPVMMQPTDVCITGSTMSITPLETPIPYERVADAWRRMSAAFSLSRSRIVKLEAEIKKLHAERAALSVATVPPKHDETPILAEDKPKPPTQPNPFREFPVDRRRIGAWHAT